MYSIEVGQVFPPVVDKGEGVYFDISGSTCTLIYNFNSPTQEEIDAVRANQPFEIRFLQRGNALWILSKCGSLDWTDTAYNPHLSKEVALEHPTEKTLGLLLTFIMTDARTGIVKALRGIGLGNRFSNRFIDAVNELTENPFNAEEYNASLVLMQMRYQSRDLAKLARDYYKIS